MDEVTIRPECLRPAWDGWLQPTGAEVREVLRLAGFSGAPLGRRGLRHPIHGMGRALRFCRLRDYLEATLNGGFTPGERF